MEFRGQCITVYKTRGKLEGSGGIFSEEIPPPPPNAALTSTWLIAVATATYMICAQDAMNAIAITSCVHSVGMTHKSM